ncbi:hypothetical protein LguiB_000064 [Lonicera macranthoides]
MAIKRKASAKSTSSKKSKGSVESTSDFVEEPILTDNADPEDEESRLIGEPVDDKEALQRWPHRYLKKMGKEVAGSKTSKMEGGSEENIQAKKHFTRAKVDGRIIFELGDHAHVKAGEGEESYICKIEEMFEGLNGSPYITARWFYRAKDTVIKSCANFIDDKRVFLSEIRNDNELDCLLEKINIVQLPLSVDLDTKKAVPSDCHYYYDMLYLVPYSSFVNLPNDNVEDENESDSAVSSEAGVPVKVGTEVTLVENHKNAEITMLDLYSGCGAMSTGLCLGANMSGGLNLVTKWAVDMNKYACDSLELNHPETKVRNERAEDFLSLLKKWEELVVSWRGRDNSQQQCEAPMADEKGDDDDDDDEANDEEEFEVEKVISICYGDPNDIDKHGLYFKGNVDVLCGGPPCQGISGFNRFRNEENPLDDEKNKQIDVFMDFVSFLKPKFLLMENVVDILKFAGGFLGRYALGRLVGMNYQARMGMMIAGSYGLPQFRMRMFMWGACPTERLPQYPLPTHKVVSKGGAPAEFEMNVVGYEEGCNVELEKELFLGDAISDLPPVNNDEVRDEMPYGDEMPATEFQQFIRLRKDEMLGFTTQSSEPSSHVLFDHQPLQLNEDDYQRVCQVPKRKGANFRDLKGLRFRGKKVELDPDVERPLLPSNKPLVPDYAISFRKGTSKKPFRRLWWDETVPTVVTRAEPHNQAILHPVQDRVLTIRENARLQGFPDYYKLLGPIKERYIQVGNAVAVPAARALGYALALASKGSCSEGPLLRLPNKFPILESTSSDVDEDN